MKALITAPFSESAIKRLKKYMDVKYENWRKTNILYQDPKDYIKKIKQEEADVLITEGDEIDREVMEECDIRIIGVCRGDPVNVDIESATKKGIPVFYTPHRNADAVADLTIALMLSQLRKLIQIDRTLRSGKFYVDTAEALTEMFERFKGTELGNKVIGIVGFGAIGYRVAKRLRFGFGCKILVYDPYADERLIKEVDGERVDLHTLLKESDIVTIHAKLTEETIGMIGKKEIELMKPTAYLFNTARSAIVDEDALFEALKNKRIAGAGLDVFDVEPVDSDNRFLQLDNVTVTPHIGGMTIETEERHSMMIVEDIERYLRGERPKYIKNPEILED